MMDVNPIINCVASAVCLHHPDPFCPVRHCGLVRWMIGRLVIKTTVFLQRFRPHNPMIDWRNESEFDTTFTDTFSHKHMQLFVQKLHSGHLKGGIQEKRVGTPHGIRATSHLLSGLRTSTKILPSMPQKTWHSYPLIINDLMRNNKKIQCAHFDNVKHR